MRLLRWRRRAKAAAYVPRHSTAWAAPAYPPAERTEAAVRLGFSDGSEVELAASHPNAVALRAVADLLVQDERRPAEN